SPVSQDEQAFFFYLKCHERCSRANEASARDRHEYLFGSFSGPLSKALRMPPAKPTESPLYRWGRHRKATLCVPFGPLKMRSPKNRKVPTLEEVVVAR